MSEQQGAGRAILEAIAAMEGRYLRALDELGQRLVDMEKRLARGGGGAAPAGVADDSDLDSEWGNPEIKKNPPRWQGGDFAGKRLSECTPEFLEELASFHDWRVTKAEDDKKAGYARRDASRARGWAARLRAGWKPPVPEGDATTSGWG